MGENNYAPEGICDKTTAYYTGQALKAAQINGKILESTSLLCGSDMSLTVNLGSMKGIIPREEAAFSPTGEAVKDIAIITRVGKSVCFKVTGFDYLSGERIAVLSRKKAQEECYREHLSRMSPGDICDARVTHMENFGAFADIGCGIISLMPIDCISVSRISHPKDRFYPGMRLKAVIKSFEPDGRIFISHKELLGTWAQNAALFECGHTVPGIIRSVESYGIFIELTPNLAGLSEYRDDVHEGQSASVFIKNIIPEKMKVKLVLVDTYTCENPPPLRFDYFITSGRLDRWVYSPPECGKLTETVFT